MSHWPSTKAKRVLAALLRIGWSIKRQSGSHITLKLVQTPIGAAYRLRLGLPSSAVSTSYRASLLAGKP